jgi:lipid A 4'-phosphatase
MGKVRGYKIRRHSSWLVPLILFLAILPFTPQLDLTIAESFYNPVEDGKGKFIENGITHFFYEWGEYPAFITGSLAALLLLLSLFFTYLKKWRQGALILLLTLVLGSGLIVNTLLKGYCKRPRPKQIEEFGGKYAFRPIYYPHFSIKKEKDDQKSFPSGHVTMGFFFISFAIVGRRYKSSLLFYLGIAMTLFWGGSLMMVRIMQGGHFFSDTLAAALIMWEVSLGIDKLIPFKINNS